MKHKYTLLILACTSILCSCSTSLFNAESQQCGRRVQTDRERCLRHVQENAAALATRGNPEREARESWADETTAGIEAAASRQAP